MNDFLKTWWLECSPMARETWIQSQVEPYQRKKWYLMPPCLTLSIIRYGSRIKWSNPGKRVATKQRVKPRIPWETLAVRKKRADVTTASKCNGRNLTNINALKLKKAQNELAKMYLKEQTEYIQNQINKIKHSVEGRQSKIAFAQSPGALEYTDCTSAEG